MNSSNITSQASLTTRAKVWFESLPFFTRGVLMVCVGIYLVGVFVGFDSYGSVCLSAVNIVQKLQLWRVVTATVFHMGLLHIVFNMMAFVPIGQSLERALGTSQFAYLIMLLAVLGDALYVAVSYTAAYPLRQGEEWLYKCGVGFSGVLFGLIVVDNSQSQAATRSIFGLFAVPAKLYPWALLLLWQLLMPGASFLGHASGVVVGQMVVWGWLKRLQPTSSAVQSTEESRWLGWAYRHPAFVACTGGGLASTSQQLPTSFPAVAAGPSSRGEATGGHLQGSWFNQGWLRVPSADPDTSRPGGINSGISGGGLFQPKEQGSAFKGKPHTLGSAGAGPALPWGNPAPAPGLAAQTLNPNLTDSPAQPARLGPTAAAAAAAAAAEARIARAKAACGSSGGPDRASNGDAGKLQHAGTADSASLQQLEAMGFAPDKALAALQAAGGSLEAAIEVLSGST